MEDRRAISFEAFGVGAGPEVIAGTESRLEPGVLVPLALELRLTQWVQVAPPR